LRALGSESLDKVVSPSWLASVLSSGQHTSHVIASLRQVLLWYHQENITVPLASVGEGLLRKVAPQQVVAFAPVTWASRSSSGFARAQSCAVAIDWEAMYVF